ncbi:MAG: sulfur oxidation c-type cytochrome SoxX [Thiohalobacterales bacterium]
MRHTARNITTTVLSLATLLGALLLTPFQASAAGATAVEKGKAVAVNRKKGNCLACHAMEDGTLPGNIGPPLVAMKARYPDKAKLRAQIWDATAPNPNSIMPPFGRHRLLSEEEIDQITEYVYTL